MTKQHRFTGPSHGRWSTVEDVSGGSQNASSTKKTADEHCLPPNRIFKSWHLAPKHTEHVQSTSMQKGAFGPSYIFYGEVLVSRQDFSN